MQQGFSGALRKAATDAIRQTDSEEELALVCSTMQHKNMRAWIFSILVLCFLWCFSIPDLAQEESGAAAIRVLESK
jgi:hypothetical protein